MIFFNNQLIQNIIFSLIIILIFKILSYIVAYIIIKMFHLKDKKKKIINNAFYKPIKTFVFILGFYFGFKILNLPGNIWSIAEKVFRIAIICLIANGFANLFSTSTDSFNKLKNKINFKGNDTVLGFISKFIKTAIYILAGFVIVSELGYNLNGIVAGLGISTVVVALAVQDIAKSILAGASIIIDKPFEIGDYIIIGAVEGTVTDISFRSTKIKNIDNHITIIPNNQIVTTNITNCSKKDRRRYSAIFMIKLNTPKEKISNLSNKIQVILNKNQNIDKSSIKTLLYSISNKGMEFSISFYTEITKSDEFLQFKEEINFELLDILNELQIELS